MLVPVTKPRMGPLGVFVWFILLIKLVGFIYGCIVLSTEEHDIQRINLSFYDVEEKNQASESISAVWYFSIFMTVLCAMAIFLFGCAQFFGTSECWFEKECLSTMTKIYSVLYFFIIGGTFFYFQEGAPLDPVKKNTPKLWEYFVFCFVEYALFCGSMILISIWACCSEY